MEEEMFDKNFAVTLPRKSATYRNFVWKKEIQ